MRAQDVMTDQVYKVTPDTTAEDAWNLMRIRRSSSRRHSGRPHCWPALRS